MDVERTRLMWRQRTRAICYHALHEGKNCEGGFPIDGVPAVRPNSPNKPMCTGASLVKCNLVQTEVAKFAEFAHVKAVEEIELLKIAQQKIIDEVVSDKVHALSMLELREKEVAVLRNIAQSETKLQKRIKELEAELGRKTVLASGLLRRLHKPSRRRRKPKKKVSVREWEKKLGRKFRRNLFRPGNTAWRHRKCQDTSSQEQEILKPQTPLLK